jgi:hypothetical protein
VAPPAPGTLSVSVDVSGARITLDGRVLAESARAARVDVAPGEHTLAVSARRRRPYEQKVSVASGARVDLKIKLARASSSSSSSSSSSGEHRTPRGENYLVNPFGKHK